MLKINNNINNSPSFRGLTLGPKSQNVLNKIGGLQSPGQRLIFGAAALAIQPAIDRHNPWVDDETRQASANRSIAKAIVCTTTGVIIREACILGTNALLNGKKFASKLPEFVTKDKAHSAGVIGTLMGLGVMVFTNFLIDAPLTNKFTNFITAKKHKKQNPELQQDKEIKTPPPKLAGASEAMKKISGPAQGKISRPFDKNTAPKQNAGENSHLSQANAEVIRQWAS